MLDERKKLRTAEADGTCRVMDEFGNSHTHTDLDRDTNNGGSSLPNTADAEEENHISVDMEVDDTTTVASVSCDKVSTAAGIIQSTSSSSVADVIDVDAIDTEVSCDEDNKDKSVSCRNPQKLGLNEFFLQPTTDDVPAENVIDVDAETAEAASDLIGSLDTAEHIPLAVYTDNKGTVEHSEEKSCGTEFAATSSDSNDKTSDEVLASVIAVKVHSTEAVSRSPLISAETSPVAVASKDSDVSKKSSGDDRASDARTESQSTEPEVTSATDRQTVDTAGSGEMVESVVESREHSMDKDLTVGTNELVEIPPRENVEVENTTNSDMESREVEMVAVDHHLPTEQLSSVPGVEEIVSEAVAVEHKSVAESCSRDEIVSEAVAVELESVAESCSRDEEIVSEPVAVEHKSVAESCSRNEMIVSEPVGVELESVAEGCSSDEEIVSEPVAVELESVAESCSRDEKVIDVAAVSQTDALSTSSEQNASLQKTESSADDKSMSLCDETGCGKSECVAEVMELIDVDGDERVEVTDKLVSDVDKDASAEIQQKADEVEQHAEVMDIGDTVPSEDVTDAVDDIKEMIAESGTVEANVQSREITEMAHYEDANVSDSTERFQQRVEMTADTDNGDVSELKMSTAVSDAAEATVDEDPVDKQNEPRHTELIDKATADTDLCQAESTTLKAVDGGVAASLEATGYELTTEMIDMVEADAGDTEPTHSYVDTADALVSNASAVLPTTCESSPVDESAGSEFCDDGKNEEGEKAEMTVELLTSSDTAAE